MHSFTDVHCDTVTKAMRNKEELFSNSCHLDLKRLMCYNSPLQFFAIWLEPYFYPTALKETLIAIEFYHSQLEKNKDIIGHVNSYNDILENKSLGKISGLLSIEGGEALEGDIKMLEVFYRLGVRAMTLTWNHKNALAVGVGENDRNEGMSDFGKEVVREMNRLGMIVDVFHISDKCFWEVAEITTKPFISSHSNSRKICGVQRNLTDEQIITISNSGGVIGINFYGNFITDSGKCVAEDLFKHIDHIIDIAGDDCIGFGSDFDGISVTPEGLEDVTKMATFIEKIEKRYGIHRAKKFAEDNFLRVIKEILI